VLPSSSQPFCKPSTSPADPRAIASRLRLSDTRAKESPMAGKPTCIRAYTGENERYRPLDQQALQAAKEAGARLIYYDADAASRLGAAGASPLPTVWSADGEQEQFGNRLDPVHLEKAGRAWLRDTVVAARAEGVDAYGWLPSSNSAESLAEY